MAGRIKIAATFRELASALMADLRDLCSRDPFAPKWVVVPTSTLANHLRVTLARVSTSSASAGARIVNLPRFASELVGSLMGQELPSWNSWHDLTLVELVEKISPRSPLANLREIAGGGGMLRAAFTDLAEGGFGVDDLGKLEDLANEPELSRREQEVLRLYAAWVRLLHQRRIPWSPLTLQTMASRMEDFSDHDLRFALRAEEGQEPQIFVYGFYDWIDVNLQWLAALSKRVPTTFYYPYHSEGKKTHAAFSFAEPVLLDIQVRLGASGFETLPTNQSEVADFFLTTFPEGQVPRQPPFLTYQRASGIQAEAVSAAVRIRQWLDEQIAPEEILVVAPHAEEYLEAVESTFRDFAIPLRVTDVTVGPTTESETLQMLARIWEEQAPAEWVLAFLRSHPQAPIAKGVDIESFELKVRELGVWGGWAWRAALEKDHFEVDKEETGHRKVAFTPDEKKLIGAILKFVDETPSIAAKRLSVRDAGEVLRHFRDGWLAGASLLAPLIEAAENFARYNGTLKVSLTQWARLLAECGGSQTRRDPLCRAVSFVPLMRARGLTTRAVVVLGLAAGQLPFRVEDDPLLSEGASARLAQLAEQLGHRMPLKARVTDEMLLLFFLINTCAGQVHWVVPDSDASGKAVAPTPWVQRYLQRWDSAKKADNKSNSFAPRVARAPFEQAVYLAGLDNRNGSMLPPSLALYVAPDTQTKNKLVAIPSELFASIEKRGRDANYSGVIKPNLVRLPKHIGVTALENLAKCPFRFYAERIAQWEPLEPLALSFSLDALTRGGLLHCLLEQALRPNLGTKTMEQVAGEMLARDSTTLRELAHSLDATAPKAAFALAMLPPLFKEAALRDVVGMATRFFEWAQHSEAVPLQVEAWFERDFPNLAGVQIVGKIDLVEKSNTGLRLLDFKTSKKPPNNYRKTVRLGWQIQAVLYPWLSGHPDASFAYIFLKLAVETGDNKEAPDADSFLSELATILAKGIFVPTSNQVFETWGLNSNYPCNFCSYTSVCRKFEPHHAQRHAELFERLAPERKASILKEASSNAAAQSTDITTAPKKTRAERETK